MNLRKIALRIINAALYQPTLTPTRLLLVDGMDPGGGAPVRSRMAPDWRLWYLSHVKRRAPRGPMRAAAGSTSSPKPLPAAAVSAPERIGHTDALPALHGTPQEAQRSPDATQGKALPRWLAIGAACATVAGVAGGALALMSSRLDRIDDRLSQKIFEVSTEVGGLRADVARQGAKLDQIDERVKTLESRFNAKFGAY